jgi:hypothetical protein
MGLCRWSQPGLGMAAWPGLVLAAESELQWNQGWWRGRLRWELVKGKGVDPVYTFLAALVVVLFEMDHHFNDVSSELFVSFACLDPREGFSKFI